MKMKCKRYIVHMWTLPTREIFLHYIKCYVLIIKFSKVGRLDIGLPLWNSSMLPYIFYWPTTAVRSDWEVVLKVALLFNVTLKIEGGIDYESNL